MNYKKLAVVGLGAAIIGLPTLVLSQPPAGAQGGPPGAGAPGAPGRGGAPGGAPGGGRGGAAPAPLVSSTDISTAPSGTYNLDVRHLSIVAKVLHSGKSWTAFRMDEARGTLQWDAANPTASKIDVTVDANSVTSSLAGFGEEMLGAAYLNAAAFPEIKFVSTSIERTGPNTGIIHADMTFRGVTKPVQAQAEFIATGKTIRGEDTIGFNAKFEFARADFGMTGGGTQAGPVIRVEIDSEWLRPPTE